MILIYPFFSRWLSITHLRVGIWIRWRHKWRRRWLGNRRPTRPGGGFRPPNPRAAKVPGPRARYYQRTRNAAIQPHCRQKPRSRHWNHQRNRTRQRNRSRPEQPNRWRTGKRSRLFWCRDQRRNVTSPRDDHISLPDRLRLVRRYHIGHRLD